MMDVGCVRRVFEKLQPGDARHAAIAFYHALVLSEGWQETEDKRKGWDDESADVITFYYEKDGKEAMLKTIPMENKLLLHFQADGGNIQSSECSVSSLVNNDTDTRNPDKCLTLEAFEAATTFIASIFPRPPPRSGEAEGATRAQGRAYPRPPDVGGPEGPQPGVPPDTERGQVPSSIYDIGRSDLDPNLGMYSRPPPPGSGMYMGPDHPLFQGPNPEGGVPQGLPRGSVPPGARFDPVTPFGGPMGRGRGRGRGRGGSSLGEPNPDHFRPPRGFDPFL